MCCCHSQDETRLYLIIRSAEKVTSCNLPSFPDLYASSILWRAEKIAADLFNAGHKRCLQQETAVHQGQSISAQLHLASSTEPRTPTDTDSHPAPWTLHVTLMRCGVFYLHIYKPSKSNLTWSSFSFSVFYFISYSTTLAFFTLHILISSLHQFFSTFSLRAQKWSSSPKQSPYMWKAVIIVVLYIPASANPTSAFGPHL